MPPCHAVALAKADRTCGISASMSQSPAMERQSEQLTKGYAALFATIAIWSMPSLFQFYLNRFYDPWAQNFYRYTVACVAIAPFFLLQFRSRAPRIDRAAFIACLWPCLPNVVHQVTQVMALFYMGPGVYA